MNISTQNQRIYNKTVIHEETIATTKSPIIHPTQLPEAEPYSVLLDMVTLQYSPPSSITKFSTTRSFISQIRNNDTKPSNFIPFSTNHHPSLILQSLEDDKHHKFKRREAMGFAFGFSLSNFMLTSLPQATSAAESAAPCELTMAASGIAFCDKIVGYGPQAEKGQLIKVIH